MSSDRKFLDDAMIALAKNGPDGTWQASLDGSPHKYVQREGTEAWAKRVAEEALALASAREEILVRCQEQDAAAQQDHNAAVWDALGGPGTIKRIASAKERADAMKARVDATRDRLLARLAEVKAELRVARDACARIRRERDEARMEAERWKRTLEETKRALPQDDTSNWSGELVGVGAATANAIRKLTEERDEARADSERLRSEASPRICECGHPDSQHGFYAGSHPASCASGCPCRKFALRSTPPAVFTVDIEAVDRYLRDCGFPKTQREITANTIRKHARPADALALTDAIERLFEDRAPTYAEIARAALAHLGLALAQEPRKEGT